ncbi:MAG: tetratricopeptide repeat protein [Bacteroidetes bacterium]|nr:tetratricopeptide repeat protein [Bacteroidota bacterium]
MKQYILFGLFVCATLNLLGQSLGDAIKKTNNERYPEALRDFKRLVATTPNDGNAYYYFGDCYFKKGEIDSAVLTWNKGFEVDNINPMPMVGKLRSLWIKGDKAAAQVELNKALELTKGKKLVAKRSEVLRGAAEGYIKSEIKDLDQALTLLLEAIEKDPTNEDNYLLQGDALYEQAKKIALTNNTALNANEAIKSYNKVLEINPKSPRGKLRVANIYQAAENEVEANRIYKEAIAIDSTFAPAYRERAEMLMRFDKMNLAIQDWKKFLALNNNRDSRYRYAGALYKAKQYCEAIEMVVGVNQEGLINFYTERILAKSYLECQNLSNAMQLGLDASNRFFNLAPEKELTYLDFKTRGALLMKTGSDSLGLMEWEKAMLLSENALKELSSEMAREYWRMKKYDKAIETYMRRQSVVELTLQELYNLGQCYFSGPKNFKEADTLFAKVAAMSLNYAPAYMWRGRCNFQMDPTNALWLAKPYYSKVLEIVVGDDRKKESNKKMVIESARYMGGYYGASSEKDPVKAKEYFQIVYDVDPSDAQAKQILGIK